MTNTLCIVSLCVVGDDNVNYDKLRIHLIGGLTISTLKINRVDVVSENFGFVANYIITLVGVGKGKESEVSQIISDVLNCYNVRKKSLLYQPISIG
jgi:hypothetical protein